MSLATMIRDAEFTAGLLRKKPFNCLLQVTNRCNMKCSFCDFWPNAAPKGEELTLADYRRLEGELSDLGRFLLSIEGGEPLVRSDLLDILRVLSRRHLPALFTNGWYIDRDKARALFDTGISTVSVSLDYPDAARHDAKRRLPGAYDRVLAALDHLLAAAPNGARQVYVMTVVMDDNWQEVEPLLALTKARGVGHQLTLLSTTGFRRGKAGEDRMPPPHIGAQLVDQWKRYPHLAFFREYFERMDDFLTGAPMPTCHAGAQSFNIDHVGEVSPCIERIDWSFGNVKRERLGAIHARMVAAAEEVGRCQRCWTACRGVAQALGEGGSPRALYDLATRMKAS
jgi:MoaA/NifB/PqqE/SkfB family radical SAM enzyme